ncbi:MAG: septum formation initiator family protein [Syntrophaceae bacterium]|nr:septum formation initiator family protein [Syntrophaceae bacterium]
MKIGRYLIIFLLVMALLITFGNRGLVDSYFMSKKLSELESLNKENAAENKELKKKIALLRDNVGYLEYMARSELGMVKEGDIVYRLIK